MTRLRRSLPIAALLAVLGAFAATPANASIYPSSYSTICNSGFFSQVFARWLDPSPYGLVPGGDIEGALTTWSLRGDARKVAGNEPYYLHSKADTQSLLLPPGSSTTTQRLCVTLFYPSMRFMAKGAPGALLKAEVILQNPLGGTLTAPMGVVVGSGAWHPSLPMLIAGNLLALVGRNGQSTVSFRFTPLTGSWQIDDVYVDPYRQR